MKQTELGGFELHLSRQAAKSDLSYRQKLSTLRLELSEAPSLCPLSDLWIEKYSNPIGLKITLDNLLNLPSVEGGDFFILSWREIDGRFLQLRKVKLKVNKPFVISLCEVDEYLLTQIRVLGADAFRIQASRLDPVALQLAVEMARELRLEAIIACESIADLERLESTDASFFSAPYGLVNKYALRSARPILEIDEPRQLEELKHFSAHSGFLIDLDTWFG